MALIALAGLAVVPAALSSSRTATPRTVASVRPAHRDARALHRSVRDARLEPGPLRGPYRVSCPGGQYRMFLFTVGVVDTDDVEQVVGQVAKAAPSAYQRSAGPLPELVGKRWALRFTGPDGPQGYVSVSTPCQPIPA